MVRNAIITLLALTVMVLTSPSAVFARGGGGHGGHGGGHFGEGVSERASEAPAGLEVADFADVDFAGAASAFTTTATLILTTTAPTTATMAGIWSANV
jgi:hypothetical protein